MDGRREGNRWRERSYERGRMIHRYHRPEPMRRGSPYPNRQAEFSGRRSYAAVLKQGLREQNDENQNKQHRDHVNDIFYQNDFEQYNSYEDWEHDDGEWMRVRARPRRNHGRRHGAAQLNGRVRMYDQEDFFERNQRGFVSTTRGRERREERTRRGWERSSGGWRTGDQRGPLRVHDGNERRCYGRQDGDRRPAARRRDQRGAPDRYRRHGRAEERRPAADEWQRGAHSRRRGPDRRTRPVSNDRRIETQTNDPNFTRQVRVINKLIKAVHHLKNVTDVDAPPTNINKMTDTLIGFIKPASPTERTLNLIEDNAKNWGKTSMTILKEHYNDVIDEQSEEFLNVAGEEWSAPFEVAVKWARRNLGRKLSTDTTDHVEALLIAKIAQTRPTDQVETSGQTDMTRETWRPTTTPPPPIPLPRRARQRAAPPAHLDDIEPAPPDPTMTPRVQVHPPQSTNEATSAAGASPARRGSSHVQAAALVHVAPQQSTVLPPITSRSSGTSDEEQSGEEGEEDDEGVTSEEDSIISHTPVTTPQQNAHPTVRSIQQVTTAEQEGAGDPPEVNSHTCNIVRHENTITDYEYSVSGKIIIMGDSTVSKLADCSEEDLQVDSFPGTDFGHAVVLLLGLKVNNSVHTTVLSFGLDCRASNPRLNAIPEMEEAIKYAKLKFPNAKVWVPLINYSRSLPPQEQLNIDRLNDYIEKNCLFIPQLARSQFSTGKDRIHWTNYTTDSMLHHWLNYTLF